MIEKTELDKFLLDDKAVQFNYIYGPLVKLKYNDNIDFLYMPSEVRFSVEKNLRYMGLFEKQSKKLYGESYFFDNIRNDFLKNTCYKSNLDEVYEEFQDRCNELLGKYIENNINELKKKGTQLFQEYITNNGKEEYLKKEVIKAYIYSNYEKKQIKYKNYGNREDTLINYLQNKEETVLNEFNTYINSKQDVLYTKFNVYQNTKMITQKESIGAEILIAEFEANILKELKENPQNEFKKSFDIINAINSVDSKMLSLTIIDEGKIVDFKYPTEKLKTLYLYNGYIQDTKAREKVEKIYANRDLKIEDIYQIKYRTHTLYEDSNKQINEEYKKNIDDDLYDYE